MSLISGAVKLNKLSDSLRSVTASSKLPLEIRKFRTCADFRILYKILSAKKTQIIIRLIYNYSRRTSQFNLFEFDPYKFTYLIIHKSIKHKTKQLEYMIFYFFIFFMLSIYLSAFDFVFFGDRILAVSNGSLNSSLQFLHGTITGRRKSGGRKKKATICRRRPH